MNAFQALMTLGSRAKSTWTMFSARTWSSISAKARLAVGHFRPVGYKTVVYLPELGKPQVPIGSKVFWQSGR